MDKENPMERRETVHRPRFYRIGIGFIAASFLIWCVPFIAPFTPISPKNKVGIITGAIVLAEILFWGGALMVGKEGASKFRRYWNPQDWRK